MMLRIFFFCCFLFTGIASADTIVFDAVSAPIYRTGDTRVCYYRGLYKLDRNTGRGYWLPSFPSAGHTNGFYTPWLAVGTDPTPYLHKGPILDAPFPDMYYLLRDRYLSEQESLEGNPPQ